MARFEQFFHWTYRINPHDQEACRKGIMSDAASTVKMDEKLAPKEGDPAWAWLEKQNNFDLRLYAYVKTLFEEQVRRFCLIYQPYILLFIKNSLL